MCTALSVFATHFLEIDFSVGSTIFVPGYPKEELTEIRAVAYPSADALAARYEEEALPREGENLLVIFVFISSKQWAVEPKSL